jgi:hypothetical protein
MQIPNPFPIVTGQGSNTIYAIAIFRANTENRDKNTECCSTKIPKWNDTKIVSVYGIIEANGLPKCNSLATSLLTQLRESYDSGGCGVVGKRFV